MDRDSPPTRRRRTSVGHQLVGLLGFLTVVVTVVGATVALLFAGWLQGAAEANDRWRSVDQRLATIAMVGEALGDDAASMDAGTATAALVERRSITLDGELTAFQTSVSSLPDVDPDLGVEWLTRTQATAEELSAAGAAAATAPVAERAVAQERLAAALDGFRFEIDDVEAEMLATESRALDDRRHRANGVLMWVGLGVAVTAVTVGAMLLVGQRLSTRDVQLVDALSRQANEDSLTGLINRRGFNARVAESLGEEMLARYRAAIIFLDLDGFKRVNDTLGHDVGDELLVLVAERLKTCVRASDLVARLGGDEFGLLLSWERNSGFDPTRVASRIQEELSRPFRAGTHELQIGASVGVRMVGDGVESAADVIRDADIAMYRSKVGGGDSVKVHEASMTEEAEKRVAIEASMHQSVANQAFRVVYQPVFDSRGRLAGAETQIRWPLSDGTEVRHEDFVAVAVDLGFSDSVDIQAMELATAAFAELNGALEQPLVVTVTMAAEAVQMGGLEAKIEQALDASGLAAESLMVRITDRNASSRARRLLGNIEAIQGIGVSVSMDELPSLAEQVAADMISSAQLASQGGVDGDAVDFDDFARLARDLVGGMPADAVGADQA